MLKDGRSTATIARIVKRTPQAITQRLIRQRGTTVTHQRNPGAVAPLPLTQVAALFGVVHPVIRRWIIDGMLASVERYRPPNPPGRPVMVAVETLLDFIAHQPTWFLWDPARITDPDWRDEALRLRAETPHRWFDAPALADHLGYARMTVTHWFGEGRIPGAICHRGRYYVWSANLEGWQAPQDRQDDHGRQQAAMQAWATRRAKKAG